MVYRLEPNRQPRETPAAQFFQPTAPENYERGTLIHWASRMSWCLYFHQYPCLANHGDIAWRSWFWKASLMVSTMHTFQRKHYVSWRVDRHPKTIQLSQRSQYSPLGPPHADLRALTSSQQSALSKSTSRSQPGKALGNGATKKPAYGLERVHDSLYSRGVKPHLLCASVQ